MAGAEGTTGLKLLIGPLTTPIMETFGIDEAQMGAVFTGALIVGGLSYFPTLAMGPLVEQLLMGI